MARDTVDLVAQPPGMIIADGQLVVATTLWKPVIWGLESQLCILRYCHDYSLSIYLSICLSIYLSIYIYIYVYISICRAEPCIAGCLGIIDWEHCNLSFGHMGYPCQMSRLLRNLWKKSTEPWKCGWNEGLSIEQGDFLGSTTRAIASEIHWNPGIVSFMSCSVIYQLSWTPNVHTYINTYVRTYVCVCIYIYT